MAIGIATIIARSFIATTRKPGAGLVVRALVCSNDCLLGWLYEGLNERSIRFAASTYPERSFYSSASSTQCFLMSGFVLEINCDMMNWGEFRSTGSPNLGRRWRLFFKRNAKRSIDSVTRCFFVENSDTRRRRCTSGGSANADFRACLKLSSFWRSVVSSVNLVFSVDNAEFGYSSMHACCSKMSLAAACRWVVWTSKDSRNSLTSSWVVWSKRNYVSWRAGIRKDSL